MGQSGTKANGTHSGHFESKPILFTQNNAYDSKNNVYGVENGKKYFIYNDFIFFTSNNSTITAFLNESPKKNVKLTVGDSIKALYMDNYSIFLMTGEGSVYRSSSEGGSEYEIYFIFFNYDEFKAKEERGESTKEIDIRTTAPTVFTFLNVLKGNGTTTNTSKKGTNDNPQYDGNSFDGIDITGVDFIFYILGGESKRIWTIIGDDGRRDETFKKMAEAFDIG
jgi:hypothetical protein